MAIEDITEAYSYMSFPRCKIGTKTHGHWPNPFQPGNAIRSSIYITLEAAAMCNERLVASGDYTDGWVFVTDNCAQASLYRPRENAYSIISLFLEHADSYAMRAKDAETGEMVTVGTLGELVGDEHMSGIAAEYWVTPVNDTPTVLSGARIITFNKKIGSFDESETSPSGTATVQAFYPANAELSSVQIPGIEGVSACITKSSAVGIIGFTTLGYGGGSVSKSIYPLTTPSFIPKYPFLQNIGEAWPKEDEKKERNPDTLRLQHARLDRHFMNRILARAEALDTIVRWYPNPKLRQYSDIAAFESEALPGQFGVVGYYEGGKNTISTSWEMPKGDVSEAWELIKNMSNPTIDYSTRTGYISRASFTASASLRTTDSSDSQTKSSSAKIEQTKSSSAKIEQTRNQILYKPVFPIGAIRNPPFRYYVEFWAVIVEMRPSFNGVQGVKRPNGITSNWDWIANNDMNELLAAGRDLAMEGFTDYVAHNWILTGNSWVGRTFTFTPSIFTEETNGGAVKCRVKMVKVGRTEGGFNPVFWFHPPAPTIDPESVLKNQYLYTNSYYSQDGVTVDRYDSGVIVYASLGGFIELVRPLFKHPNKGAIT